MEKITVNDLTNEVNDLARKCEKNDIAHVFVFSDGKHLKTGGAFNSAEDLSAILYFATLSADAEFNGLLKKALILASAKIALDKL